nr:ABC transporter ATP-binding protein [Leucobacter aridicollis]
MVEDVAVEFKTASGTYLALQGIDIEIPQGGFTTLLGPSGCGKSTLLRTIADIIAPTRGTLNLFGQTPREARLDGAFGFVFQDPVLLPWRTCLENVALPLQVAKVPRVERTERARAMLALVGLEGFEDRMPSQISGGMARRVAIARALVLSPRILFLDEPFNGLDELRRRQLNEELQRIWLESGTTAILVTHNVSEAVFMSDRVLVMGRNPGRIIADETISLPRPRTQDLTRASEFLEYEDRLTSLLTDAYRGLDD